MNKINEVEDNMANAEQRAARKLDQLLEENKELNGQVLKLGQTVKELSQRYNLVTRNEELKLETTVRKDPDQFATSQKGTLSVTSSSMKQGPSNILDSLREKAHSLIKKLTLLYKEASKIDLAYDGTLDLMKGWTKTSNSSRKEYIDKLIEGLESMVDTVDIKSYKDKIAMFKQNETLIISSCQQNFKALCDALEVDIDTLSTGIVTKSKKLSQLKTEMDKIEPGKQIPATLRASK